MKSKPQNPEFRINPENFHPSIYGCVTGYNFQMIFSSVKTIFVSANPDEMPCPAVFHLSLHSLPKYLLTCSQFTKG